MYFTGQLGLGIAQVGLMPNPSKQFLDSFGGADLKLPTLIVMHSNPSAEEDQAPQMQVGACMGVHGRVCCARVA